jgi:coenzyme F420-reducing hydrogenase delta subunit/ferredoxin
MDNNGLRIGVFLCNCGGTVDSIDLLEVADHCRKIEEVIHIEMYDFLCSPSMSESMGQSIKDYDLERIVIGACSPRIYMDHFRDIAESSGINRYMVEMANLREQCAWIHTCEGKEATEKAKDQMLMAIARSRRMIPSIHGTIASVDAELCDGCGVCKTVCEADAISIVSRKEEEGLLSYVDPKICEGCGVCVSSCPSGAMDMELFSNDEILAEVDAATEGSYGFPHIVVFACHWCGYAAGDMAGIKRIQMDPRFRVVRTLCSARVDPEWILRALSNGADGVMIIGGKPGHCHFEVGSLRTRKRMTLLGKLLSQFGFDRGRFKVAWIDADQPEEYANVVNSFIEEVVKLGPNPMNEPREEVSGLTGTWAEKLARLKE